MSTYYRLFTFGYEGTSYKQLAAEDITADVVASMKLTPVFGDGELASEGGGVWFRKQFDEFLSLAPFVLEIDADVRPESFVYVYAPPLGVEGDALIMAVIHSEGPEMSISITSAKLWSAKPIPGFWTNFRKCKEIDA